MDHEGNQSHGKRDFKDVQKVLSSHEISEKYNEQGSVLQKKVVLKNFAMFTAKNLCWSLLFNKNFIKKGLQHRCFVDKIAKFLRTAILKNI